MSNDKPRVFISYRRYNDEHLIGRIHDYLSLQLGEENVFWDRDSIVTEWETEITQGVEQSNAVLIILDPNWLNSLNERIHQQRDDFMYQEIKLAIENKKQIIPLLINGAEMPSEADLPPDLQGICKWQVYRLYSVEDFPNVMAKIVGGLNHNIQARGSSKEVKDLLETIKDIHNSPRERVRAGRRLAELGDPRPGIGLKDGFPDIDWIRIPMGEFLYGGLYERSARSVQPQQVYLPMFYISRYTVTFAQFRSFIEAKDGFRNDKWWDGFVDPAREEDTQEWRYDNHPREHVSWYNAVAFCRWLSYKLGYEIHLPTEYEWEKAARSSVEFIYPWGNIYYNGYANINEMTTNSPQIYYVSTTTAVGIYPQGTSPFGVHDMCGNVWEWCFNNSEGELDLVGNSKYVIRGGSFWDDYDFVRITNRQFKPPNTSDRNLGFRVVCEKPNNGL